MRSTRLAAILLGASCANAWPQEITETNRADLPTVYVTTDEDGEITGALRGLNDEAVTLLVGETTCRYALEDVSRIERKGDSVKNGALIGAVIGFAVGIFTSGIADCVDDTGGVGRCGEGARIGFVALSSGLYAGAGAGIDAWIPGRSLIYGSRNSPEMPVGMAGGVRVGFTLRW